MCRASGNKTVNIEMRGNPLEVDIIPVQGLPLVERVFDIPATETGLTLHIDGGSAGTGQIFNATSVDPQRGGCIRALAGNLVLENLQLDHCEGFKNGGVVYIQDADLTVVDVDFFDNDVSPPSGQGAEDTFGGAISAHNSSVDILSSEFQRNLAKTGGAIHVSADEDEGSYLGSLEMLGGVVEDNEGVKRGGGLALFAPCEITTSNILENGSTMMCFARRARATAVGGAMLPACSATATRARW